MPGHVVLVSELGRCQLVPGWMRLIAYVSTYVSPFLHLLEQVADHQVDVCLDVLCGGQARPDTVS